MTDQQAPCRQCQIAGALALALMTAVAGWIVSITVRGIRRASSS